MAAAARFGWGLFTSIGGARSPQLFKECLLQLGQSSATLSGAAVAMQCCPSHAPGFRTNQVCLYLTIALEGETCKTDIATFDAILDVEKLDPLSGSYAVHWRTDFSVQGPVHAPDSYESLFNPDGEIPRRATVL